MREIVVLFVHLIATVVRLARPGGLRAVVAESVLVRHQLLILNRGANEIRIWTSWSGLPSLRRKQHAIFCVALRRDENSAKWRSAIGTRERRADLIQTERIRRPVDPKCEGSAEILEFAHNRFRLCEAIRGDPAVARHHH